MTIRKLRQKIDLEKFGIEGVNVRRAMTGAYVFEVPGADSNLKADKLALGMRKALSRKEGIKIQRPIKMAELRLRGLDESVRAPEVIEAIAREGNCEQEEVQLGEMRRTPGKLRIIWVRCPLKTANKIVQQARIKVGEALARVELLEGHPLQCYKYL